MLEEFEDFDPTRPGIIEMLDSWKKALGDTFVHLGQLETALIDATKMDSVIAELFHLPTEDNKVITSAKFQPKSTSATFNLNFEMKDITFDSINELRKFANAVTSLYEVLDVVHEEDAAVIILEDPELFWEVTTNLSLSEDKMTVTKRIYSDENCQAIASKGWNVGVHSWKFRVNGGEDGLTTTREIFWIAIGVASGYFKQHPLDKNYVPGHTFGHSTWDSTELFSLDKVSGCPVCVGPNTVITLSLDCDNGILSFSRDESEYLIINVPRNTILYPWADLSHINNCVTIE